MRSNIKDGNFITEKFHSMSPLHLFENALPRDSGKLKQLISKIRVSDAS